MTIYVIGMNDKIPDSDAQDVINTTSRSTDLGRGLSPFLLGPCDLYDGYTSQNMENAWQFSKVYDGHLTDKSEVKDEYWTWAKQGWADSFAHRYPMGRGAKPKFSLWGGKKLSYIEARKQIYIPLYSVAVQKSDAFKQLVERVEADGVVGGLRNLYLRDFDGYNHKALGMSYDDVINREDKKMGHAFVVAMLLEKHL